VSLFPSLAIFSLVPLMLALLLTLLITLLLPLHDIILVTLEGVPRACFSAPLLYELR
jgi:hypothetical protein